MPKRFLERQTGQISEGFLFGNNDTPILEDSDLVYVGPMEKVLQRFLHRRTKSFGQKQNEQSQSALPRPSKIWRHI